MRCYVAVVVFSMQLTLTHTPTECVRNNKHGVRFERESIVERVKKEWKKVSYFRSIVVVAVADDDRHRV